MVNALVPIFLLFSIVCSVCLVLLHNNTKLLKKLEEKVNNVCIGADEQQHAYADDTRYPINRSEFSHQSRYLVVKGAIGDGVTDDTRAIQKAINKASNNVKDGVVLLPKGIFLITKPIVLKGGVTLRGQGYGSSPLQIKFDAGGTVIAYCGEDYAIKIVGHAAAVENLAVYDWQYPAGSECQTMKSKGGVIVSANGKLVESVTMRNILIYWFMGGTSLTLEAINAGGIAYASMENIRIRHAKVGLHLSAADDQSFVNSNTFHDGAISGGITDVGVLATGPGACNDNQFRSMVIEPPSTLIAHVHVSGSKTNVILDRVRLEGTDMTGPLVIVEDDSYGNIMNGLLGHTHVQADLNRNPGITFATNKMTGVHPAPHNLFWNAAFHGIDVDGQSVPGWTFTGSDFSFDLVPTSQEPLLYPDHNVLSIEKSGSTTLKLTQSGLPRSHAHSFCTFGVYAKSSIPSSISAAMKSRSGTTIASSSHTGSGKWEFIGLSSLFDQTNGGLPYFSITGNVMITSPTFSYGYGPATVGAEFLSASRARMSGVLSMNMVEVSPPTGGGFWRTLPREGNIFKISPYPESGSTPTCSSTSYETITRINDSGSTRFDVGTVITLLLPECGECVPCVAIAHGSYIKLLGNANFIPPPTASHSSITLVSAGSGSWIEVSRNMI